MKNRIKIDELKVQSFSTSLSNTEFIKGGSTGDTRYSACGDPFSPTYFGCPFTSNDCSNTSDTCSAVYCATNQQECQPTGYEYSTCDGWSPTCTPGSNGC